MRNNATWRRQAPARRMINLPVTADPVKTGRRRGREEEPRLGAPEAQNTNAMNTRLAWAPRTLLISLLVSNLLATVTWASSDLQRYKDVQTALKALKKPSSDRAVALRFSSLVPVRWPDLELLRVALGPQGAEAWFDGHPRARVVGDDILGAQVVSIDPGKVVLQNEGERRTYRTQGDFPEILVREIRRIEEVPVVFFDQEKRARYAGDTYRDVRIVTIEPRSILVEYQGLDRRLHLPEAEEIEPDFPDIRVTGTLAMPAGMMAFVDGESQAHGVGETIGGARILSITSRHVVFEYNGETRQIGVSHEIRAPSRKNDRTREREDRSRFRVVRPSNEKSRSKGNDPQQQVEKLLPQIFQDVRRLLKQ